MKRNEPWSDVPDCMMFDDEGYWQEETEENELIFL